MKRITFIQKLAIPLFILLFMMTINAQEIDRKIPFKRYPTYQYAVKFICGKSEGKIVAPGVYFTAINIHNPTDTKVTFQYKVAVALLGQPGPVSEFDKMTLETDEAIEIDCPQIIKLSGKISDFGKGFVVIESGKKLDVVAVYTVQGFNKGIETMHMERVSPRTFKGCPDLKVINIEKPIWEPNNRRSVIKATIKNIGNANAGPTTAQIYDPGSFIIIYTLPHSATAATPALAPGASATVTFYLLYPVYDPNAYLEVTADYDNNLKECKENNNKKVFAEAG